jgi:hypothetical protein
MRRFLARLFKGSPKLPTTILVPNRRLPLHRMEALREAWVKLHTGPR